MVAKKKRGRPRKVRKLSEKKNPIRALAEQDAPDVAPAVDYSLVKIERKARGSSGTESYSGYPAEEYLTTLRSTQRADLFDEMRRSDSQIKMCLGLVNDSIKSGKIEIEPGDDSEEAAQDAELVDYILNNMDRPLSQWLSEALTVVVFGHSVFEVTGKVVLDHPDFGSFNGIRSLGWRSPRTIERFNLDPETGALVSVTQIAQGDLYRYVDIPAAHCLVTTLDLEGSNYEGVSMLRACYGPWFRKNEYLKLNAIGIEKHAVPTPTVEIPAGKENSAEKAALEEALAIYTTHQANYLLYPAGWTINLNTNTYDPEKVERSIEAEEKRIAKAFRANFMELGISTSTGSWSLSNDLSDFFLSGLEAIANVCLEPMNQRLIPTIVRMNRGERGVYPKMRISGISDKAGKELAEALSILAGSKILTPDDPLEVHLRKRMGLPAMSEEGQRIAAPPAPAGAGFGASNPTLAEKIALRNRMRAAQRHPAGE